jgi:hypothetical protein
MIVLAFDAVGATGCTASRGATTVLACGVLERDVTSGGAARAGRPGTSAAATTVA